jgi:hypothetical protein
MSGNGRLGCLKSSYRRWRACACEILRLINAGSVAI